MTRKLSDWNIFVKKVYNEGKAKNPNYEFKQALEDASKRKSEMKHSSLASGVRTKSSKKSKKERSRHISFAGGRSRNTSFAGGRRTRRRHSRRHRH